MPLVKISPEALEVLEGTFDKRVRNALSVDGKSLWLPEPVFRPLKNHARCGETISQVIIRLGTRPLQSEEASDERL